MTTLTSPEQLMLELINRARMDPAAEAARMGIDLNQFNTTGTAITATSKQVLAGNNSLAGIAESHSVAMDVSDVQANPNLNPHDQAGDGTMTSRFVNIGYPSGTWRIGENVAWNPGTADLDALTKTLHEGLFKDDPAWNTGSSVGHRLNILDDRFREVGIGEVTGSIGGTAATLVTEDFGVHGTNFFLSGAVYNDTVIRDDFYSVGEGVANVTASVTQAGAAVGSDATGSGGGWTVGMPGGTYTVTFSGGELATAVSATVEAGARNAKVDLVNGNEIFSNVNTTLGAGARELHLLGMDNVNGTGNADANVILGNKGANVLAGLGGNDDIDGADGTDTVVFSGARSDYKITITSGTSAIFQDLRGVSPDGTDIVRNIELVRFTDVTVNFGDLRTTEVAGSVAISDVVITEGDSGSKLATFTIARSLGTAAFDVSYATANGTATAGSDYVAAASSVHFNAGETSKTVSITINGDTVVEASETFNVLLSGATNGATISDNTGIGTISNDDVAPVAGSVAISDVVITEGDSGTKLAIFTVARSGGTAAFDVNYATSNGTATAGSDYVAAASSVHFNAGETSKTLSVTISGDTVMEASETFNVLLSGATNGATIIDNTGIGTISNDDVAPVAGSVAISDVVITEGDSGTKLAIFTVARSGGTAAFDVNYATSNGTATAGSDYVAAASSVHFNAGETSKTLSVTINGDTVAEASETFSVLLSGATNGATISDGTGVGTISNDDVAPVAGSVAISDVVITEGDSGTKLATFTVARSSGTAAFDVNYATANGTATAGSDYVAAASSVHFNAGETSKTVSITINGDTVAEASETFNVLLSGATNGATISDGTGVGTISNDDVAPVAGSVAISDVVITEGDSGTKLATFTVARSSGTAAFDVNYATANGTATAGSDYVAAASSVHFNAGETSKTISVTVNGDAKAEASETFNILLSGATNGATISDGTGVGTISNDDVAPVAGSVAISDVAITEGASGTKLATFTVTRAAGTAAFDVNFATSNGTATTADGDYVANSGSLHFNAGETSKTISVTVNGDAKVEANETFNVLLSGATNGATISDATGVGTITNDDTAGKADLVVSSISAPTSVGQDSVLNFSFMVKNLGDTAAGLHYAGISVDTPADQSHYVAWNTVNSLAGNGQATLTASIDTSGLSVGQHTLYITEDFWNNAVAESNESNNALAVTFNVTGNHAPTVTTYDQTVGTNEWSQAYWFIDYQDPDGDAITQFRFFDGGTATNSGYLWTPDNAHHDAGTTVTVDAAHLEDVWFRGGSADGTESLWVQAYDGHDWSQWQAVNVTTDSHLYA